MVKTAGDELRSWMERSGRSYDSVADALEITPAYISSLLTGARSPSLVLAVRIAELTGIPPAAWTKVVVTSRKAS